MAEIKDKVVNVESLKAVYDSLYNRISLESMGVTATAEELSKLSGITVTAEELNDVKPQFEQLSAKLDNTVSTASVSLVADNWASTADTILAELFPYAQTVSVDGVTSDNTIIIGAYWGSRKDYAECEVSCCSQSDGSLTFCCETLPLSNIQVNIIILN